MSPYKDQEKRKRIAREGMQRLRQNKEHVTQKFVKLACVNPKCNHRWYSNPSTWKPVNGKLQPKKCPNCGYSEYIRLCKSKKKIVKKKPIKKVQVPLVSGEQPIIAQTN